MAYLKISGLALGAAMGVCALALPSAASAQTVQFLDDSGAVIDPAANADDAVCLNGAGGNLEVDPDANCGGQNDTPVGGVSLSDGAQLNVSGAGATPSAVNVTGGAELNVDSGSTLNANGTTSFGPDGNVNFQNGFTVGDTSVDADGTVHVGGSITLNPDGTVPSTIGAIEVDTSQATVNGDLTVQGATNLNGATTVTDSVEDGVAGLTVVGVGSDPALSVGGNVAVNGTTSTTDLQVGNNATINGTTSTGDLQVSNNATINGTTSTTDLQVGNNATVGNTLAVTGQSFLNGGATVQNNLTVVGPANVDFGNNIVHGVDDPLVATDAANKRYVDSEIAKLDDELSAGIAMATALENPDLTGRETFGVMVNYGNYEGSSAIAVTAMGVLGYNVLEPGDRVSLGGGVGFSTDEGQVGGRVGLQWTR
jgi:hypothetical protein